VASLLILSFIHLSTNCTRAQRYQSNKN